MKVCFVYSNRSEYSILLPYIEYFKKTSKEINLKKKIKKIEKDQNLSKIYDICYNDFIENNYDFVCVLGDRREISFVALAALHSNTKLVHLAAGEFAQGTPTYDQYIRPTISLLSKFQICFSQDAKKEVEKLFNGVSYLKSRAYVFGNPVFSKIDIKKIKRKIEHDYDLVLIHPQSLSREQTKKDLKILGKKIKNKKTIFINGNKDKNYDIIELFYRKLKNDKNYTFIDSLPKKEYFSLVKYCDKFYTNSSSFSEINFINKKCLEKIGLRNKKRFESKFDTKSPNKLYKLLKNNINN